MSSMTVTAIILLIIGPLPWYFLLVIASRELRLKALDKNRAIIRLCQAVFSGYIIEIVGLIATVCYNLHISIAGTICWSIVGLLGITLSHVAIFCNVHIDQLLKKTVCSYDKLRGFPSEISSR
ncbi:MAG: hypothetical protein Q4B27_02610 [Candidatus Saccharibacteria bacterium]|nr:hypothetical protein [Candidatus Saccharibacteria bacterium]